MDYQGIRRVLLLVAVCVVAMAAHDRASAQAARGDLFLDNGDLVTASGKSDSVIRLRPRPGGYTLTKVPMLRDGVPIRLKPKAVTYSKFCERVAIANSTNVVTYDVWSNEIKVIESDDFGLIADVEWDMQCNLIIADMGRESVGRWPRDGAVWMYTADGGLRRLAMVARNWVNPAFLDMDEWGTLYVVDKAAGPVIPGSNRQWHYDAIYKMGSPDFRIPKARYRKAGLEVTAFAVHPDGRFFIGNGDHILVLEGTKLSACGGSGFRRVNGIDVNQNLEVFALDGFDVFGKSTVFQIDVDNDCAAVPFANGGMVNGAQGLAIGLPAR